MFAEVDKLISSSEWNKSAPRTKKALLEVPESTGRLEFTHLLGSKHKEVTVLDH